MLMSPSTTSAFEMEKVGQPSGWNTLRALRILKWYYEE
jgi:hypothetical protein